MGSLSVILAGFVCLRFLFFALSPCSASLAACYCCAVNKQQTVGKLKVLETAACLCLFVGTHTARHTHTHTATHTLTCNKRIAASVGFFLLLLLFLVVTIGHKYTPKYAGQLPRPRLRHPKSVLICCPALLLCLLQVCWLAACMCVCVCVWGTTLHTVCVEMGFMF